MERCPIDTLLVLVYFTDEDSDSEFNDGEEVGDFDLFGRLEESRAQLEDELGAEKLIQVYKTVQVCIQISLKLCLLCGINEMNIWKPYTIIENER